MEKLTLISKQGTYQSPLELDVTIVELSKKHKVPWGYACQRGICAQCRTHVVSGGTHLNEITDAEKARLRKAERAEGFRLGCQIRIKTAGEIELAHRPY